MGMLKEFKEFAQANTDKTLKFKDDTGYLIQFTEYKTEPFTIQAVDGRRSQAFNIPAFPVDTHIHRLMTRWGLTNGKSVVQTERDAKKIFPEEKWNKLHIQIILYGREYSPARSPKLSRDYITVAIRSKKVLKDYKD